MKIRQCMWTNYKMWISYKVIQLPQNISKTLKVMTVYYKQTIFTARCIKALKLTLRQLIDWIQYYLFQEKLRQWACTTTICELSWKPAQRQLIEWIPCDLFSRKLGNTYEWRNLKNLNILQACTKPTIT